MPLPQMTGDAGTLLQGDTAAGAPGPTPSNESGGSEVSTQDQVRGAIQQIGAVRQQATKTLEAIAQQFPGAAQSAKGMSDAIDQALQRLMKDLVKQTQQPEPQGPRILR